MPDISSDYADPALDGGLTPSTTYFMSLHTAAPGSNGSNEVVGGSYVRQPLTLGNATGFYQVSTNGQSFTGMPAESGSLYYGVWSASVSGTYYIGTPNPAVTGPVAAGAAITFASGAASVMAG